MNNFPGWHSQLSLSVSYIFPIIFNKLEGQFKYSGSVVIEDKAQLHTDIINKMRRVYSANNSWSSVGHWNSYKVGNGQVTVGVTAGWLNFNPKAFKGKKSEQPCIGTFWKEWQATYCREACWLKKMRQKHHRKTPSWEFKGLLRFRRGRGVMCMQ